MSERIEPDRPYDPFDGLWRDEEPDYPTTPDDARKHLQDFADARRDKYVSAKRICAMGHRLKGSATLCTEDWIPYLILVRRWCEASEQEG